jgi:hypothetical protein
MNLRLVKFITKVLTPSGVSNPVKKFLNRISLLPQERDRENIENVKRYLDAVGQVLRQLEEAGISKEERLKIAKELYVPVVEATMKALVLRQKCPDLFIGESIIRPKTHHDFN